MNTSNTSTPYHCLTEKHRADFWTRVDTSGGPESCWPWTRSLETAGYGQFCLRIAGKDYTLKAHKVAWTFTRGPIERDPSLEPGQQGTVVMHSCDNRRCCNPAHLSTGTQRQNIRDCFERDRARPGGRALKRSAAANENTTSVTSAAPAALEAA